MLLVHSGWWRGVLSIGLEFILSKVCCHPRRHSVQYEPAKGPISRMCSAEILVLFSL